MGKDNSQKGESVAKSASILVITTLISSVLGYVRNIVITSKFGAGVESDAYYAAFTIPDLIYTTLVGGGLSSAFIPVFSGYLAKKEEKYGMKMANTIVTLVAAFAALLCMLGVIFAPYLVRLLVQFEGESYNLTVKLTRIMFAQSFFMCLTGISQGILQSYKRFSSPAIGAVFYNITIIAGGIFLSSVFHLGVAGFSIAVVIGAIINFGIQVPNMYKTGFRYSPALDFKNDGVRQFFRLLGPVLIGTSVMEINLMVNQYFASGIGSSVITLMKQSQTIMLLPVRIFGASIALSIFPTLSGYYATGHMDNYVKDFSKCLRTVLFIVIPIIGMFITLRVPLVRAMYRQGSFTEEMVQDMAYLLMFYSVGIVAYSVREVMIRGFYAVKDTKTPVKINVFILSLNCVLSALFVRPLGVIGLVFAYLIAGFVSMSLLTYFLRKKLGGLQGRKVVQSAIKIIISSAVMMVVLVVFRISIEHFADVTSKLQQLIELMLLGIVGVGIYMLMSYLLKTEEMENAIDMLRSKFGRLLKFKKKRQES